MKLDKKTILATLATVIAVSIMPSFAFGYEVESKPGTIIWTNITASDAYNVCQNMKSGTSSIGSGALNPHMSTPQDWDAVSVLAISNYGESNYDNQGSYGGYKSTTNNATGVMGFGIYNAQNGITPAYTFTSGIMAHASNDSKKQALIDNKDTAFVSVIYDGDQAYNYYPTTDTTIQAQMETFRNNIANKGMGIMLADSSNPNETGGLNTWKNTYLPNGYWGYKDDRGYFYNNANSSVFVKNNLFGFGVGYDYSRGLLRAVRRPILHLDQYFGIVNVLN